MDQYPGSRHAARPQRFQSPHYRAWTSDDTFLSECFKLRGLQTEDLAQDFFRMCANWRARPADHARRFRDVRHDSSMEDLTELRILHLAHHSTMPELRVCRAFRRGVDLGAGNVRLGQAAIHLGDPQL